MDISVNIPELATQTPVTGQNHQILTDIKLLQEIKEWVSGDSKYTVCHKCGHLEKSILAFFVYSCSQFNAFIRMNIRPLKINTWV